MDRKEMLGKAKALFAEWKALVEAGTQEPGISAEEKEKRDNLLAEAQALQKKAAQLKEVETMAAQIDADLAAEQADEPAPTDPGKFKTFGEMLCAVAQYYNPMAFRDNIHPALREIKRWSGDVGELGHERKFSMQNHWTETKVSMAEGVGATGGFLVPDEFRAELLGDEYEDNPIRSRATVIPMRRRALRVPVLDQTGTTADQPHQYGGIIATWTEEAGSKAQYDATFRQIELVAHKLVCYTESSQELLDDSAVGLEAFLRGPMGFGGAIRWQEEYCFLQGTGVGQPLGIIPANGTITVARAAAGAVGIVDIINMVSQIHGDSPVWHINRGVMPSIIQLNGPAGNPSYVWIPNAREGLPSTLFGYPVYWTEKCPVLGTAGDVCLCNWPHYLIGDRQATTIDSSIHAEFRTDEVAWRAVHRVDGQEWLSTPWTLADGTTQISPFVILGDVAT
jgi:HK97 family phage major capsid protein